MNRGFLSGSLPIRHDDEQRQEDTRGASMQSRERSHTSRRKSPADNRSDGAISVRSGTAASRYVSAHDPQQDVDSTMTNRSERSSRGEDDMRFHYYENDDPEVLLERLKAYVQIPDKSESKRAQEFLAQQQNTFFAVDGLSNMPIFTGSTRVTIYFAVPTGRVLQQLTSVIPLASVQSENSPCLNPVFPNLATTAPIQPKVVGVLSVEVIDRRTQKYHTFGHVVVPLFGKRGTFAERLRPGPVNSELFGATGRVDSDVQHAGNSNWSVVCARIPLVTVTYRVNEMSTLQQPFSLFEPSPEELAMLSNRPRDATTPADHGLRFAVADAIFNDQGACYHTGVKGLLPDLGAHLYNQNTGVVIAIHSLHGIQPTRVPNMQDSWKVLFKVVVSCGTHTDFTTEHDWEADVSTPRFCDFMTAVRGLDFDPHAHITVQVVEMRPEFDGPESISWDFAVVGHAFVPLFQPEERFVRFSPELPVNIFIGEPATEVVSSLKSHHVNEVVGKHIREGRIALLGGASLKLSFADALRVKEIRERHFSRLAHQAAMPITTATAPASLQKAFVGDSSHDVVRINSSANDALRKKLHMVS